MLPVLSPVALLQIAAACLLNASFAWLVGSIFTRFCLRSMPSRQIETTLVLIWQRERLALLLCCVGVCAALWSGAAVMSGSSLQDAARILPLMLLQTAFGQGGLFGLLILILFGAVRLLAQKRVVRDLALAVLLAAFALSRVAVGHGAENGMLSLGLAVEWLHLLLIALWLGVVALAAWVVLPLAVVERLPVAAAAFVKPYLSRLSHAALLALCGIVATGIYNAWQRLGKFSHLSDNTYGIVLCIKLSMVGLAVVLGGYNKFFGFPAADSAAGRRRAIAVLRIESLLLLGALMAAALLTSQQPPASF